MAHLDYCDQSVDGRDDLGSMSHLFEPKPMPIDRLADLADKMSRWQYPRGQGVRVTVDDIIDLLASERYWRERALAAERKG